MPTKLGLIFCASAISFAHADVPKKAPLSALALTPVLLTGTGTALIKKVNASKAGRVVFDDHDGGWVVNYAIALASPLRSAELDLKISDVSRTKQKVSTRHKLVYGDAPVVRGSFRLGRDEVLCPNAKLLVEIEDEGVTVAKREFFIRSKVADTSSKVVEFSSAEAEGDDDVDASELASHRH